MAQPAEMRMKPRRLAKCSRGAVADAGALALLSEAQAGEVEVVSVAMGTFLMRDAECFRSGFCDFE